MYVHITDLSQLKRILTLSIHIFADYAIMRLLMRV